MRLSSYFKFRLPEGSDPVNIEDFNENFEEIDKKLNEVANKAGDVSKGTVFAETAKNRENLASGDTMDKVVGKLMRWLSDLSDAAFCKVANNDMTETEGYVADARVLKTHKTALDKHEDELGGLYFGTDGSGKWGYKTSKNGAVTAFRKPAGNASVGDVLSGKTFANASEDSLTGAMVNRGAWTGATTGNGDVTIPAGYHNGSGYVSGAGAYNAGVADGKQAVKDNPNDYGMIDASKMRVDPVVAKNRWETFTATEDCIVIISGTAEAGSCGAHATTPGGCPDDSRDTGAQTNISTDGILLSSSNLNAQVKSGMLQFAINARLKAGQHVFVSGRTWGNQSNNKGAVAWSYSIIHLTR